MGFSRDQRQIKILTRHFYLRLFRNDIVDFEDQMIERIIGILAIIAVFCGFFSNLILCKYALTPDAGTSWREKAVIFTLYMLVMGLVAVFEWDVLLLDRRDYSNLSVLPIKIHVLFLSKLTSLVLFAGLFFMALNSISITQFLMFLPQWQSSNVLYIIPYGLIHLFVSFLACVFSFFFFVLLRGIMINLLGVHLYNKISVYIRAIFLIITSTMLLIYLKAIFEGFENLAIFQNLDTTSLSIQEFAKYFPPIWFTALYERLLGNSDLPIIFSSSYALRGLLVMVVVFILITFLSKRRYMKNIGISRKKWSLNKHLNQISKTILNKVILINPIQRAIFYFYQKSIKGSIVHKMRLYIYIALALSLILIQFISHGVLLSSSLRMTRTFVSIPLIISVFLILGIRNISGVPISIDANWIFMITEKRKLWHYFSGYWKSIVFTNLIPAFLIILLINLFFWDFKSSFLYCAYGLLVAFLFLEIHLISWHKIPFACTYLPGKEKIQLYWSIYLILYIVYINFFSWLGAELLNNSQHFLYFFLFLSVIILSIRFLNYFYTHRKFRLRYQENPEPVMIGFDYETPQHKKEVI